MHRSKERGQNLQEFPPFLGGGERSLAKAQRRKEERMKLRRIHEKACGRTWPVELETVRLVHFLVG